MNKNLPTPNILSELEAYAVSILREAGNILSQYQSLPTSLDFKSDHQTDPVTTADLALEAFIRDKIYDKYPDHSIIGEETDTEQQVYGDYIWIIDPLDGTANFANGLVLHGISIGITYKGSPIVGCIYIPNSYKYGDIFRATLGGGAFINETQLDISHIADINPAGLTGLPHMAHRRFDFSKLRNIGMGEIRVTGSIVYEMILISKGVMQLALFGNPHIWDIAAGIVIVREAGGDVLQWSGKGWESLTTMLDSQEDNAIRKSRLPIMIGSSKLTQYMADKIFVREDILARLLHYIRRIIMSR
tara:strand:- start:141 stop:1046 length:906 start_codon:yes stop_codon:yes gene_type:complete